MVIIETIIARNMIVYVLNKKHNCGRIKNTNRGAVFDPIDNVFVNYLAAGDNFQLPLKQALKMRIKRLTALKEK